MKFKFDEIAINSTLKKSLLRKIKPIILGLSISNPVIFRLLSGAPM